MDDTSHSLACAYAPLAEPGVLMTVLRDWLQTREGGARPDRRSGASTPSATRESTRARPAQASRPSPGILGEPDANPGWLDEHEVQCACVLMWQRRSWWLNGATSRKTTYTARHAMSRRTRRR